MSASRVSLNRLTTARSFWMKSAICLWICRPKILRVLQEQEVTRIGGTQNIQVDVRIVAATNQELIERVRQKEFREDLYYRLNVVPINLVPAQGTPRGYTGSGALFP